MRIIVTGGTGLIGRSLGRALAADGHEVIALTRSPERQVRGDAPGVRLVGWDGRTAEGWGALADGADAIVSLAGESVASGRWSDARKARIRDSRLEATTAVVEAVRAAANPPAVVVQASAVGYYGPRGDEILEESASPGGDFLARVCQGTEDAAAPLREMGVRVPVIRTGVVLDASDGALPRMVQPFKMFAGGPLGNGRQYFPWIHVADQVGAIRFLIDDESAEGPFNLTAPTPVTNKAFGAVLGRVLGRPALLPTPGAVMKIVFGEMSTVLLDGQRAVPSNLVAAGYTFAFPEVEPALRDLIG